MKEAWRDKGQKAKCVYIFGGLKKYKPVHHLLSNEGYGPASETREHDCKIPLLFLDVEITEPRFLLLFH